MSRILRQSVSSSLVVRLVASGSLTKTTGEKLLTGLFSRVSWRAPLQTFSLSLGVILVLIGLSALLTHYWVHLGRLAKMGIAEGIFILFGAGGIFFPEGSRLQRLALAAAALSLGFVGEVGARLYFPQADRYQWWAFWAITSLPFVWRAAYAALWVFWVLQLNLIVGFYWGEVILPNEIASWKEGCVALGLLNTLFLSPISTKALGRWGQLCLWFLALTQLCAPGVDALWEHGLALWGWQGVWVVLALAASGLGFAAYYAQGQFSETALPIMAWGFLIGSLAMHFVLRWLGEDLTTLLFFQGWIVTMVILAEGEGLRWLYRRLHQERRHS